MRQKARWILGIDPDKGWGLAKRGCLFAAGTVKDITALKKIISDFSISFKNCKVLIEKPTNPKVFPRPGVPYFAMLKIARNVGQNFEKAEELGRFCQENKIEYQFVIPNRRKINCTDFRKITDYLKRTSQHARDAALIAVVGV